jgi:uncharacterized protein YbaR (Trm112 family)
MPIDPRLLEILCCPVCRNRVTPLANDAGLQCTGCRRIYPIIDGIPDMIAEDATTPER